MPWMNLVQMKIRFWLNRWRVSIKYVKDHQQKKKNSIKSAKIDPKYFAFIINQSWQHENSGFTISNIIKEIQLTAYFFQWKKQVPSLHKELKKFWK